MISSGFLAVAMIALPAPRRLTNRLLELQFSSKDGGLRDVSRRCSERLLSAHRRRGRGV